MRRSHSFVPILADPAQDTAVEDFEEDLGLITKFILQHEGVSSLVFGSGKTILILINLNKNVFPFERVGFHEFSVNTGENKISHILYFFGK